jgi:16S rRNA G966 N2-methylase RsmD
MSDAGADGDGVSDQDGTPTDDVVLASHLGYNAQVFPQVLQLHVDAGAKIADVTYGKGNFWDNVSNETYDLFCTDINPNRSPDSPDGEGVDCRDLPYDDNTFDVVVLDPPYAEGYYRRNEDHLAGNGSHSPFRTNYSTGEAYEEQPKYHQAVLAVYFEGGREANRVLRDDGTLIMKVGDEVSANTQELTHIQVTNFYERELGFYTKDLFVVERHNTPNSSGVKDQVHARKNHSFFMVYEMDGDPQNVLE